MDKLRPEQRKLWRKTFHQERDRGIEPKTAAERADEAVAAWEQRGAFDEEDMPRGSAIATSTHTHAKMKVAVKTWDLPMSTFPDVGATLTFKQYGASNIKATLAAYVTGERGDAWITFDVIVHERHVMIGWVAEFDTDWRAVGQTAVVIA